jgi:integrase/recombinase XerD
LSAEDLTPRTAAPPAAARRFDLRGARPFIDRSLSAETRAAYSRALREFFLFAGGAHPADVTPALVIAYRDRLVSSGRKAATVAARLSVVRSFFEHLRAAGAVALNPASTKLVPPPAVADTPAGRALTKREVRHLLAGPDRGRAEGARDYAMLLVMLRLSLRVAEVVRLRASSVRWDGRWAISCTVKGGREETWPLPPDVKAAIDEYLRLDAPRRALLSSGGPDAYLFQPLTNYRTLQFAKALSRRHVERIVRRWGEYGGLGRVTPHDLRRTIVTRLLDEGHSYRDVQMVTKHRDPKTVMRYDRARENLERNPINSFSYDES